MNGSQEPAPIAMQLKFCDKEELEGSVVQMSVALGSKESGWALHFTLLTLYARSVLLQPTHLATLDGEKVLAFGP